MQKLLAGYSRFRAEVYPKEPQRFERLAYGQSPQALFVTCSDSRVTPELVMQCEPGDIFPCRNAGNLVPPATEVSSGVSATIEYAVEALKVRDIVLCGHSDCGAMKAVLHPEKTDGLPAVRAWLRHAEPAMNRLREELSQRADEQEALLRLTLVNILDQASHLAQHECVSRAMQRGELTLHAWYYDIRSATLHAYDGRSNSFQRLDATGLYESAYPAQQERRSA